MAAWSVTVHVSSLKHVPPHFLDQLGGRRENITLRVQGALHGASRETAPSSWGRGARAGEAFWPGAGGVLEWRFESEEALRRAERAAPVLKLYGDRRVNRSGRRRRRGCDVDIPRETSRGAAAAATWIVRGDERRFAGTSTRRAAARARSRIPETPPRWARCRSSCQT